MFNNFKLHNEGIEEKNCCNVSSNSSLRKIECPKCDQKAKIVTAKTIKHLLTDKSISTLSCLDGFALCMSSSCEVIYFRNNEILTQKNINIVVGHKDSAVPATVCYCFDWSKEKIIAELQERGDSTAMDDIKLKMNTLGCSCMILNPSGRCCLEEIGDSVKKLKEELDIL